MYLTRNNAISSAVAACLILCAISIAHAQYPPAPIRDPDHAFQKHVCNWKQLKQLHIVMQKRDYSCGAAALATILRYYWGDSVSEEQVLAALQHILTPEEMQDRIKNGLAISDLRRAAVEMGYLSTIGTLPFRELTESKVPLVVGISPEGYDHFAVYRGTDGEFVYLADPIRGNIRVPVCEFIDQWQKNAVLVVAKPNEEPPKISQLTIRRYEVELGDLNKQLILTQPPKAYLLHR
jgi:predicted double-glycine peptidase